MKATTKEQAVFSGMKLLGLSLELLLLFLSLAPNGVVDGKFASVVLLSVLSASFSSIIALFDDDVFVKWVNWPKVTRVLAVLSIIFGFVMLLGSVALLFVVNVYDAAAQIWLPTAFAIMLLCVPRTILYGFMFAVDINGLALTPLPGKHFRAGIKVLVEEFKDR